MPLVPTVYAANALRKIPFVTTTSDAIVSVAMVVIVPAVGDAATACVSRKRRDRSISSDVMPMGRGLPTALSVRVSGHVVK